MLEIMPVSQRIRSPRKSDPGQIRYASDIDPTLADSIIFAPLLVIVANVDRAALTHTPQSVLRIVDKLPFGGVVMMLEELLSTLAAQVPATHSKSNWERMGFPVHSEGAPIQVHDYRHPTVRVPSATTSEAHDVGVCTCTLAGFEVSPLTASSADLTSPP